jgi:hypothetical protein
VGRTAISSPERCFDPSSGGGSFFSAAEDAREKEKTREEREKERKAMRDFMMSAVSGDRAGSVTKSTTAMR